MPGLAVGRSTVAEAKGADRASPRVVTAAAVAPSVLTVIRLGLEADDDGPVAVRSQDAGSRCRQTVERGLRRVAVRVARAGRRHRDRRSGRIDEGLGGRRPAAVMGDLEQVDMRQSVREQRRIDALLDVAHQQDAPLHRSGRGRRPTRC